MELHQLKYAVIVAKYQNFTRASEELCLSQPSLSQQITKLEEELGVKLFERNTRNVVITSAGRTFIEQAKHVLGEIEDIKHSMQEHMALLKGQFSIGAIPVVGKLKLSTLITAFQKKHPRLDIHISEGGSLVLFEQLCLANLDAAILTPPLEQDTSMVDFYPLIQDELVLVVSAEHPLASRSMVDFADTAQEKFICPNSTTGAYGILLQACRNAGFEPKQACECSQVDTVMSLVSDGVGIACFSSRVANAYADPGIRIVRLANAPSKSIFLATLKRNTKAPAVTAFRDFASEWIRNHN